MNHRIPYYALHRAPRNRGTNIYSTLLFFQLLDRISQLQVKPPVTLGIIALNLLIFALPSLQPLIPSQLHYLTKPIQFWTKPTHACLNPLKVIQGQRWRLIISSFVHASDLHVLYNCLSFLYKGVTLETALGSEFFMALVIFLSFVAHAIYLAVAVLASALGITDDLLNRCLVGFSGVIFGLKVVINSDARYAERATSIFGFRIPGGSSPWVELLIAQVASPNVSFLGHLSGILAGLIYVYVPRIISRRMSARRRNS